MRLSRICALTSLAVSPLLPSPAASAKGGSIGVGRAITRIELPVTSARAGEVIPIRALVDVSGTCSSLVALNGMEYLGLDTPGHMCGRPTTCEGYFEPTMITEALTVTVEAPEVGGIATAALLPCYGAAGPTMALCGELILPSWLPTGHYTRVRMDGRDAVSMAISEAPEVDFVGLEVVGSTADTHAPTVLSVDVPKGTVPPGVPGIVVSLSDDMTGATHVVIRLEPLYAGHPSDGKVLDAYAVCGTPKAGAEGKVEQACVADRPLLDRGWLNAGGTAWSTEVAAGEWYVRSITGRDRAGYGLYWEPPALVNGGKANLGSVTLRVSPGATPPALPKEVVPVPPESQVPVTESASDTGASNEEASGIDQAGAASGATDIKAPPAAARTGTNRAAAAGCAVSMTGASAPGSGLVLVVLMALGFVTRRAPSRGRIS